jgi:type VI secretion system protein
VHTDFLEILTGGTSSTRDREERVKGISRHLTNLLNSHQGYCPHMPEYGLPDLFDAYRKLPHSAQSLADAVCNCIRSFEPRLNLTELQIDPFLPSQFYLQMVASATLRDDLSSVKFSIQLSSQGRVTVDVLKGSRNA